MKPRFAVAAVLALAAGGGSSQETPPLSALARLPIREITVFKDGHVFALHEGTMPTDAAGNVVLDQLPTPVLGTFWPYSNDKAATLRSVVAGRRRVTVEQTALTIHEFIHANTGAEVVVTEKSDASREPVRYAGTLLGLPARHERELAAARVSDAPVLVEERSPVVLVQTTEGVRIAAIDSIKDITFKGTPRATGVHEELRNTLSLQLDWERRSPQKTVSVGLVYLQKGIRWIPSYRVAIDGKGSASVRLQATLVNEMIDVEGVTAHLMVGVPQFAFHETLDPISLQRQAAQLSQYFQQGERASRLSNSIMSQAAFNPAEAADIGPDAGPASGESGRNEDLFVFTIKNVTLKKNERMVLTVAEYTVPYKDIFTLNVPLAPPVEAIGNLNSEQQAELARLLASPKVTHKLRLSNDSRQPFTTAPALVVKDERLLAQGTMTYAAPGSKVDLEITKAVDVSVSKSETETRRTPNAVKSQGYDYARVDLDGTLSLANRRSGPVEVEVVRHVLGDVDAAENGQVAKANVFEDEALLAVVRSAHSEWWHRLNGVGRITWTVKLEPGAKADLTYRWHYFVR